MFLTSGHRSTRNRGRGAHSLQEAISELTLKQKVQKDEGEISCITLVIAISVQPKSLGT